MLHKFPGIVYPAEIMDWLAQHNAL